MMWRISTWTRKKASLQTRSQSRAEVLEPQARASVPLCAYSPCTAHRKSVPQFRREADELIMSKKTRVGGDKTVGLDGPKISHATADTDIIIEVGRKSAQLRQPRAVDCYLTTVPFDDHLLVAATSR